MEMDWGTAAIGILSILLCVVPFAMMHYKGKKKGKQMLQSLTEVAQKVNCNIHRHEYCGDFIIGLDENRNYAFFFKRQSEEAISQYVDLSEVKACQAIKKIRTVKTEDEIVKITERVELSFSPNAKNSSETIFELFDSTKNLQLSGELQLVDMWSKRISERVNLH